MKDLIRNRRLLYSLLPYWMVLVGLLSCVSCDNYDQRSTVFIKEASMSWDDTLSFEFSINDTIQLYDLFLEVDHTLDVLHQNYYFKVRTAVDEEMIQEQIVSLELADAKGYWLGNCSGDECVRTIPFLINTRFEKEGRYKVELQPYARDSIIKGINSFSLGIKASENE